MTKTSRLRAWVNHHSVFPSNPDPNNHAAQSHRYSHRVTVATSDLIPAQNLGASYFAEATISRLLKTPGARRIRANATCLTNFSYKVYSQWRADQFHI